RTPQVVLALDVIRSAAAAGDDPDERLPRLRSAELDLLDLEVGVQLRKNSGGDEHQPIARTLNRSRPSRGDDRSQVFASATRAESRAGGSATRACSAFRGRSPGRAARVRET